jgi:hypothetical protein
MKVSTQGRFEPRGRMELDSHLGRGPMLAEHIARKQGISMEFIHVLPAGLKSAISKS